MLAQRSKDFLIGETTQKTKKNEKKKTKKKEKKKKKMGKKSKAKKKRKETLRRRIIQRIYINNSEFFRFAELKVALEFFFIITTVTVIPSLARKLLVNPYHSHASSHEVVPSL